MQHLDTVCTCHMLHDTVMNTSIINIKTKNKQKKNMRLKFNIIMSMWPKLEENNTHICKSNDFFSRAYVTMAIRRWDWSRKLIAWILIWFDWQQLNHVLSVYMQFWLASKWRDISYIGHIQIHPAYAIMTITSCILINSIVALLRLTQV